MSSTVDGPTPTNLVIGAGRARTRSASVWLFAAVGGDASGLILQAYTGYAGRTTGYPPEIIFWVGLCLIFGITALAVLIADFSVTEFGCVVLLAGVAMELTHLVLYPQLFVYHDELIHVRVLADILRTHHLFTYNTILPTAPRYPGLETVTAGVAEMTGLSAHVSSEVVLVAARVLMTLGIFSVARRLSGSGRVAAIACLVYMADPEYLLWSSMYSYQTLALPLAFCYVSLVDRLTITRINRAYPVLAIAAVAIAMSHHLTSVGLLALLVAWLGVSSAVGKRPRYLGFAVLVLTLAVAAWGFASRKEVLPYLSGIGSTSLRSLESFFGGSSGHTLFKASGGETIPNLERVGLVLSVVILCCVLVPALWAARRSITRRRPGAIVAAAVALAYPLTAAGHLPAGTSEIADRATSFIYAPLGYVLGQWWVDLSGISGWLRRVARSLAAGVLAAVVGTLVFFGGTVLGAGPPFYRAPGKYMALANNRSIDRFTIASAQWLGRTALPNRRLYGDWINGYLDSAIGGQQYLTDMGSHIDGAWASRLLLAPPASTDATTVHSIRLQLLVVDSRIANRVAAESPYIDSGEYVPRTKTKAPRPVALHKFDTETGSNTVYDNGPIRIYDVRGAV